MIRYLVAVGVVLGALSAAYMLGTINTANRWKAIVATAEKNNATAIKDAVQVARTEEQGKAKAMADIDKSKYEELKNAITTRDRTIADLRTGAVQLRKRFTCPTSGPGQAGITTIVDDGVTPGGLSKDDVEFLLREAARADQVVVQLQALQAVVRADRGGDVSDEP